MVIRIRIVKGGMVALCAAATVAERDDVYLGDGIHHALSEKFALEEQKTYRTYRKG